nr:signal peptidase I [uncultured Acetatifactor sp.]
MRKGQDLGHKICRLSAVLILVAVVAVCIPMTVPRLMGYEVYVVVSGSMEPALPIGSALYVETAVPEEVAAGDVIAFYDRGAVITHRVVENHVVEGEFVTKGDANAENDMTPVPYGALIGRMAQSVPLLGNVMAICSGTKGKIYLACGVAGAVMLLCVGRRPGGKEA